MQPLAVRLIHVRHEIGVVDRILGHYGLLRSPVISDSALGVLNRSSERLVR